MPVEPVCPHCPDGHESPYRCAWAVWVGPERDSDGQPVSLRVQPTDGAHVAEEDAEWLRRVIRRWKSYPPGLVSEDVIDVRANTGSEEAPLRDQ